MKRSLAFTSVAILVLTILYPARPGAAEAERPILTAPKAEQIKVARSAAPEYISRDATILVFGPGGELKEAVKGSNGFTCFPDIGDRKEPYPFCGDEASMEWVTSFTEGLDEPTNTEPGVAHMMQGGWHYEKDGMILMGDEPGATGVKEPPHWMIFWPFSSSVTGLPTMPVKGFGTYIMWEESPYSHLMIYQDPLALMGGGM